MTIFLDSAYVIASINRRDKYHQVAKTLAAKYQTRHFIISDSVLLEVGNALARNFRKEAVSTIEIFLESNTIEIVHLTPELFRAGLRRYKHYSDKDWGLIDCISFEIMSRRNIFEAFTPDNHFVQAGFRALMIEGVPFDE